MTKPIGLENADAIRLVELTPETNGNPFVETWNATFENLSVKMPSPEGLLSEPVNVIRGRGVSLDTPVEVEEELGYRPDGPLVAVYARQGGGNDECWCETDDDDKHEDFCLAENNNLVRAHPQWVDEKQDEFDGTYLTHYFDPGLTQEQVNDYNEALENAASAGQSRGLVGQVDSLLMTPWAAVYAPEKARNKRSEIESEARLVVETANKQDRASSLRKIIESIDAEDFEKISQIEAIAAMRRHSDDFSARMLENTLEHLAEYTKKTADSQKLVDDAEKYLPKDSPLYMKLLGDRGQGSYQYTEKVRRRNVKKTRVYDRGSELGYEVTKNQERLNKYKEEISVRSRPLRVALDKLDCELREADLPSSQNRFDAIEQAFEIGWQWNADLLPEVPRSFLNLLWDT